ncbi:double-strand-break repair protein rad21 homolog isoform X2 [Aplysia californica]|uniref:Double-strand-break repair protein rad21 homolog isoform X2 n=1 Tax=Aplysia californica TaxID=6500 RepID=A0ABM1VWW8_APLCA|nr:double-strand-break repair protein rad21 homolog isoform X2 [Aplysia californica]
MFYASFVLNKKGPLARIWLAAHWDKKLTKAHVFETNIDSSVEAILKPKVKMALRTSGHLLLGVVRIYSRKAKYLLADCNEAFVKIKMAFRPGVVDLPEENREAAVAAITLQENFHDFETTLADLEDINVQAQFSVNQSRPEEITMREDLGQITLMGDDGFGDVGFDEREILPDAGHLDDGLYKSDEMEQEKEADHEIDRPESPIDKEKPMDIDLPPPVVGDDFGGGFMDGDDGCDEDNDDNFGDVDQDFFGQDFMGTGGLFEDPPAMPSDSTAQEAVQAASASPVPEENDKQPGEDAEESVPLQAAAPGISAVSSVGGEQTTLVHNEEEAFALEPLDITSVPGTERKGKRKRKLIVDEQKGIPSETMKLQLSDTSDIVTSLDLAPPTKKLMLWKETGGVEKVFVLPGRSIISKVSAKFFSRNLVCQSVSEDFEPGSSRIDLDLAPEIARENERNTTLADVTRQSEMSTIVEEASVVTAGDTTVQSVRQQDLGDTSHRSDRSEQLSVVDPLMPNNQSLFDQIPDNMTLQPVDVPADPTTIEPTINPLLDEGPPSVAPFSVPPPSVPPASVPPAMTFDDLEQEQDGELMPETAEQEEKRWSKRTQQMQHMFESAFTFSDTLSFKDMARNSNRKQAASRFYTLLVLKKHQAVCTEQNEPFGDILIQRGPNFGIAC